MSEKAPVKVGIAGIGGYGGNVRRTLLDAGDGVDPPVELAGACDPAPDAFPEAVAELRERGAAIHDSFEALLAMPGLEAVWLPLPIDLHRPFTEQALAAGCAVMCEKPAAATVDEVEAMIAARDRAGLAVLIGFQDVYNPRTLPVKRRLLAGAIGAVRRAHLFGCWPRPEQYFQRNTWAGAVERNGQWVLDSPANNALSHYINLALFLLGPTESAAAAPVDLEAELYRAGPVANYDTGCFRAELETGPSLLAMVTHACAHYHDPEIVIEGENGTLRHGPHEVTIETAEGTERWPREHNVRWPMVQRFARAVRGDPDPDVPAATLEVARCHAQLISGASEATPVTDVPASAQEHIVHDNGARYHAILGIEDAFARCAADHRLPHETGAFSWTRPPGRIDLRGYRHFAGPAGSAGAGRPA